MAVKQEWGSDQQRLKPEILGCVMPIAHQAAIHLLKLLLIGSLGGGTWLSTAMAQSLEPPSPQILHRLKSGDRIRVNVLGFADLSGEQLLLADGTIQLPLAGYIPIAGLTPVAAAERITIALRPYIRRPQVGVALINLRPPRISITGEVQRPGPRLLTASNAQPGETSTNPAGEEFQTLSYALTLAGGITPNADLRNIIIRRVQPAGIIGESNAGVAIATLDRTVAQLPPESVKTEITVDLWRAIQTGDLSADPRIIDGDEIIVPTANISRSEQRQLLASTVAPVSVLVQVAGEVRRPGPVQLTPTANVSTAIAAAGGPTDKARTKSIMLLRMSSTGQLERQRFAFGSAAIPVMDGDVIVVEKSRVSSLLDSVGSFLNPLTPLLFLLRN